MYLVERIEYENDCDYISEYLSDWTGEKHSNKLWKNQN